MTKASILKLPGAFHCVNTSRMRFCAFSYSIAEPCGRSVQFSMYFIVNPQFDLKSPEGLPVRAHIASRGVDILDSRTIFHAVLLVSEGVIMRRLDDGAGCGARGRRDHVSLCTRAAPGLRPRAL